MSMIYRHRTDECTAPIRLIAPPCLNRQGKLYQYPAALLSFALGNRGRATNSGRGKDYFYIFVSCVKRINSSFLLNKISTKKSLHFRARGPGGAKFVSWWGRESGREPGPRSGASYWHRQERELHLPQVHTRGSAFFFYTKTLNTGIPKQKGIA